MMQWSNDLTFEFLTLYENEPALWNSSSPHHKNKNDVHDAWLRIKTNLNSGTIPITEMKKKKENLMSTYRKLKAKIKESTKTGSGTDDIYKPEWPFYDIMAKFMDDVYKPRMTKTIITINDRDEPIVDNMRAPTSTATPSPASSSQSGSHLSTNATKRTSKNQAYALLLKISKKMDEPQQPPSAKLKYDAYGQHIAEKLRNMPQMMATYCQKIINDAIFMAETDNLTITSHIVRSETVIEAPPQLRPQQELRNIQNYYVVSPPAPKQEEPEENDSHDTSTLYRA